MCDCIQINIPLPDSILFVPQLIYAGFVLAYLAAEYWFRIRSSVAPDFIRKSYFLRIVTGQLLTIPPSIAINASLVFIVVVCYDRYVALKKPMVYKTQNHRRRSLISFILSYVIGILLEFPMCFRFTVLKIGTEYYVVRNMDFISSIFARVTGLVRAGSRSLCSCCAGFLSVLVAMEYKNPAITHRQLAANTNGSNNMVDERNLTILLFAQVVLSLIGYSSLSLQTVHLIFFVM